MSERRRQTPPDLRSGGIFKNSMDREIVVVLCELMFWNYLRMSESQVFLEGMVEVLQFSLPLK